MINKLWPSSRATPHGAGDFNSKLGETNLAAPIVLPGPRIPGIHVAGFYDDSPEDADLMQLRLRRRKREKSTSDQPSRLLG